ncbi:MAG: helix-turn-helix domain-containing protein [Lachnospiraceae bacterium]|nr:helix-turn-helix domain-containing protein [Lachnospiraceae bacterium]
MVNLSVRIKKLRQNEDLTQQQVAERIGACKSLISAYENGTRLPSYTNLIKLANLYKVSTDYLLGIDSREKIDLSGLTDAQKISLYELIKSMRRIG